MGGLYCACAILLSILCVCVCARARCRVISSSLSASHSGCCCGVVCKGGCCLCPPPPPPQSNVTTDAGLSVHLRVCEIMRLSLAAQQQRCTVYINLACGAQNDDVSMFLAAAAVLVRCRSGVLHYARVLGRGMLYSSHDRNADCVSARPPNQARR